MRYKRPESGSTNFRHINTFLFPKFQQRATRKRLQPDGTNDGLPDTRQLIVDTLCLHQNHDSSPDEESNKFQSPTHQRIELINIIDDRS